MQSEATGTNANDTPFAAQSAMSPWVNIALRALDTGVSTSQNLIEGVDRLARAGANSELPDEAQPLTPAVWGGARAALACGLALAAAMQRSAVTLFAQGWRQWITAMGEMGSITTRNGSDRRLASSSLWFAAREGGASTRSSARHGATVPIDAFTEHAAASAGTKRRGTRKKTARRAR